MPRASHPRPRPIHGRLARGIGVEGDVPSLLRRIGQPMRFCQGRRPVTRLLRPGSRKAASPSRRMPMANVINTGEPSRTALRVATLRGAHQLLDEPLVLTDPVALPILGPALEAEVRADPYQYNEPFLRVLRASVVLRSRFAEDELARDVAEGVRQYGAFGAGLAPFASRDPQAGLRVFEVDHPSTQRWKQQSLAAARIPNPASLSFV